MTDGAIIDYTPGALLYALSPSARRDLFAAAALQGLVNLAGRDIERETALAAWYADALIEALDRPKDERRPG